MKALKGLMVVGMMTVAGSAMAQSVTDGTINVTANALTVCSINAPDLNFGNYNAATGATDITSLTVTLTCTKGSNPSIAVDDTNPMIGPGFGSENLNFTIDDTVARSTSGADANIFTYAMPAAIPAGQYVSAGAYLGTATVTFSF